MKVKVQKRGESESGNISRRTARSLDDVEEEEGGGFPKFAKQDFNDNCICFEIMKIYGDRIGL